jgi:hypothetical protein
MRSPAWICPECALVIVWVTDSRRRRVPDQLRGSAPNTESEFADPGYHSTEQEVQCDWRISAPRWTRISAPRVSVGTASSRWHCGCSTTGSSAPVTPSTPRSTAAGAQLPDEASSEGLGQSHAGRSVGPPGQHPDGGAELVRGPAGERLRRTAALRRRLTWRRAGRAACPAINGVPGKPRKGDRDAAGIEQEA